MNKKLPKVKEQVLQNHIREALSYAGWYTFRMNAGRIQGKFGLIKLHEAGTPDILAIRDGKCTFIEVKIKPNKPTDLQIMKMEELERFGARCIVAYSLDDIEELLKR